MDAQQNELECDARLLSMVDEARKLMVPLEFANADERVFTLAQYANSDCCCFWLCIDLKCFLVVYLVVFCLTLSLLWPPYVIGGPLYFCPVVSFYLSSFYLLFYSSPNLSGHRLDVYHTSTHGMA